MIRHHHNRNNQQQQQPTAIQHGIESAIGALKVTAGVALVALLIHLWIGL